MSTTEYVFAVWCVLAAIGAVFAVYRWATRDCDALFRESDPDEAEVARRLERNAKRGT